MKLQDLESLYQLKSELESESKAIFATVTAKLVKPWLDAGGCNSCLGQERVVTWSTLDGPGYTEYGPCPDCTEESRKAGKKPFSMWVGGYAGAASRMVQLDELFSMPEFFKEAVLLNTYQMHLQATNKAIKEEEDRLTVGRGKTIVVVAGRKIPKGTKGECFWAGDTKYGLRVGFTTDNGETLWTAKSNVEVAA